MRTGVLVVAKAPVAGEAKTRLAAEVGPRPAAALAAASLLDTLDACEVAFPQGRRVIALAGDVHRGERSAELVERLSTWHIVRQRGETFGQRLAWAHRDGVDVLRSPVVQIGTDTPQLTARDLADVAHRLDAGSCNAVLGLAEDGGWWALGLTQPDWAAGLADIAMSTCYTGRATQDMLNGLGVEVELTRSLRDVDTAADAEVVSRAAPASRFAQTWRSLAHTMVRPMDLFDVALAGARCLVHGLPTGPVELPIDRWRTECDATDWALLGLCTGATLDIGCGPGRLSAGLVIRGIPVLGIDLAERAVMQTRGRGAPALLRDVFQPLPDEGGWGSVLLADGNIGIGGNPLRLLRRVCDLLAPGGRAVVEVAAPGTGVSTYQVQIEVYGRLSLPFPWAVVGPDALVALARNASLRVLSVTDYGQRWCAHLAKEA